jgi:hypothetical protein
VIQKESKNALTSCDARVDVWTGMPHGFVTGVDKYNAAIEALYSAGEFLGEQLGSDAG